MANRISILPVLALIILGCTSKNEPSLELKPKSFVFRFDYEKVTEVMISKNSPDSAENWTARFAHQGPEPTDWKILSAPGGKELLDRRADGNYIRHLLDTFRTLQFKEYAPRGPLASFGLETPRFAVRWKIPGTPETEMEVRIGAETQDPAAVYALVSGEPRPIIVQGAAIRMLAYVDGFETLRRRTWVTFSSDDVDKIELKQKGKPIFYAERRVGHRWNGRNRRPIKKDIRSLLEGLSHTRIQAFIDDSEKTRRLKAELNSNPLYQMIVKDRHGAPTDLRITWNGQSLVGATSDRPDAVFELYPEAIRFFRLERTAN